MSERVAVVTGASAGLQAPWTACTGRLTFSTAWTSRSSARTLLALGVVRRRARQKASARDALTAARDLFAASGCALWTQRANDELRRVGGVTGADELTAGERAIAEQAAAGLRNEEIAARLFLSRRTVESTLTQIYWKLGVRSRTEHARRLSTSSLHGAP